MLEPVLRNDDGEVVLHFKKKLKYKSELFPSRTPYRTIEYALIIFGVR